MSDLVNRLRWAATLGDLTKASERNMMEEAADHIAALETAVTQCRTLSAMLKPQADRIVELEAALHRIEYLDRPQVRGLPRRNTIQEIARAALEGGKKDDNDNH
jgi:hypothetical protein